MAAGVHRAGHRVLCDGPVEVRGGAGPHAGIDGETGQLTDGGDGGPRRLVISSEFYAVYQSAGKKADGLVNLFCWAQRRAREIRDGGNMK